MVTMVRVVALFYSLNVLCNWNSISFSLGSYCAVITQKFYEIIPTTKPDKLSTLLNFLSQHKKHKKRHESKHMSNTFDQTRTQELSTLLQNRSNSNPAWNAHAQTHAGGFKQQPQAQAMTFYNASTEHYLAQASAQAHAQPLPPPPALDAPPPAYEEDSRTYTKK
jgi:hypothetical protein